MVEAEQLPGREGGRQLDIPHVSGQRLAENTSLSTYHPVSPREQLLEVVKSCETKVASTEIVMPCACLAGGAASSGTKERLDVESEEIGLEGRGPVESLSDQSGLGAQRQL